jgi:hypothetical protein
LGAHSRRIGYIDHMTKLDAVLERIWLRIVRRVAAQANTPLAAPLEGDGPLRRFVVSQTPYIVFCLIEDDELGVEAVMQAAQNR